MRTRRPIYRLVGGITFLFAVLAATVWAATAGAGHNVTLLTVTNETPYRVEVFVEGSTTCHRINLEGHERGAPIFVEHAGAVMVNGIAKVERGDLAGYWPKREYRPPLGTGELIVNLTEAEMMPPK